LAGTERLLRVIAPHFVAGVIYEKISEDPAIWKPVRAAPILAWVLAHESHENMAAFLKGPAKRKGWRWAWLR